MLLHTDVSNTDESWFHLNGGVIKTLMSSIRQHLYSQIMVLLFFFNAQFSLFFAMLKEDKRFSWLQQDGGKGAIQPTRQ